jgi:hypothetical protein
VTDHCLLSRNYVNGIVVGKQRRRNGWTWTRLSVTAAGLDTVSSAATGRRGPADCAGGESGRLDHTSVSVSARLESLGGVGIPSSGMSDLAHCA